MGAAVATKVEGLDVGRPRPAKAQIAVQRCQSRVGRLIGEAMRRAEGGQKGAAITLRRDQAQLSRELLTGALRVRDLDDLSDAFRAELAQLLEHEYGGARLDPRERARQLIPQLVEVILEATR